MLTALRVLQRGCQAGCSARGSFIDALSATSSIDPGAGLQQLLAAASALSRSHPAATRSCAFSTGGTDPPDSDPFFRRGPAGLGGNAEGVDPAERAFIEAEQLIDDGRLEEALALLDRTLPDEERPPLEFLMTHDEEEEQAKQLRRQREQDLQEKLASRYVRKVDDFGRAYGTGKRKTAIARVWVKDGSGKITINKQPMDAYFPTLARRGDVLMALDVADRLGSTDVWATVKGGGTTGQAQAVRHGIAKALLAFDPELRPELKEWGLLTRDSRVVERKKPGKAKARKSFQWVKR